MLVKKIHSPTSVSYCEMVSGIIKNQQWAQVALYDQFFETAYYTAYRIVKNKMNAEDLVHEGFLKAFDKIHLLKDPSSVEGWLKRIVMNESLAFIKKEKIYTDQVLEESAEVEGEKEVGKGLSLKALNGAINELPEGYRIICQLNLIEEMKHDEIAESLNITASTSRSQLARAKVKLKEIILKMMK